uniref:C2H2-type domain-containing protein n=1 Tax=Chromera velia CCMP2878 TaxID=1169474 RepID=A0A0G4GRJ9_9ALVE|eukprot:Cvel_23078.t1-p1 / transcript=Cvel_23078.t1 / gene=Cvel_23078 / organism=Chromera_velia_CCMP2878 / gene_product=Zinc finger protein 420, putative / transcript_product=Zinc finger protein 420, putative / location=Cvel_scaffold2337:24012-27280(+) / protein_length=498 / sequence_SO=supercontig / SO=protein_coding / is_pseudo=false
MQASDMSVSVVWVSLFSLLVGITTRRVGGALLLGKQERGFAFLASKRVYEDRHRNSVKSRLRYTHERSLGARLRQGGREARLLFLSTPGDASLPVSSTSPDSRSVHVLAASLEAESDNREGTVASSPHSPHLSSDSPSSSSVQTEEKKKLSRRGKVPLRSSAKGAAKAEEGEGGLRKSWRGDGEQVLVEEGGREVVRWGCNHCEALFKKEAGVHIHATKIHHGVSVGMGDNALSAKSAAVRPFASMGEDALGAKSAGAAPFASMGDNALSAKSAGAAAFASMGENALSAESAGAAPFASMGEDALGAKSVGVAAFASMGEYALCAKNAGAAPFASMGEYALSAKSAGVGQSASMGEYALSAKIAGGLTSVLKTGRGGEGGGEEEEDKGEGGFFKGGGADMISSVNRPPEDFRVLGEKPRFVAIAAQSCSRVALCVGGAELASVDLIDQPAVFRSSRRWGFYSVALLVMAQVAARLAVSLHACYNMSLFPYSATQYRST